MPKKLYRNRFDVILQHDWSIEQNLAENEESMFCSFHPFADKTNSKHFNMETIFQSHTKIILSKHFKDYWGFEKLGLSYT